jgi:hypothetical protein
MPIRSNEYRQRGSLYVEAALTLPLYLGVLYASIYLSVLSVRQLGIQFLATAISDEVRQCVAVQRRADGTCNATAQKSTWEASAKRLAQSTIFTTPKLYVCPTTCTCSAECALTTTAAGDLYTVLVTADMPQLFGGTIPFLRFAETNALKGSAIGVFERGSQGGKL